MYVVSRFANYILLINAINDRRILPSVNESLNVIDVTIIYLFIYF